jgi:hypothetical protein
VYVEVLILSQNCFLLLILVFASDLIRNILLIREYEDGVQTALNNHQHEAQSYAVSHLLIS